MKNTIFWMLVIAFIAVIAIVLFTSKGQAPVIPAPTPVTPTPQPPAPATKDDMIILDYPLPGGEITSPLVITGKARGNWFFEASFPVTLVNWDGLIIAEGYATAEGEWMTTDYVPFKGTITFTRPDTRVSDRGWIILHKNNASGLPEHDNALEVEIKYK